MSRGIGPVLLTHFTPDEADEVTTDDATPTVPPGSAGPSTDETKSGVLVAPAPTGRSARHRAGRGRRALILTKSRGPKSAGSASTDLADDAVSGTNQLPAVDRLPVIDQLRNTPKNLRILAMTAIAVVLIAVAFGLVRPAFQLPGTPVPAGPGNNTGMQPGTLPDAALNGLPTTTVAPPPPPPTTQVQVTTAPPTHHATTTHAAPPPVTTETTQSGNDFDEPGQPCSQQGQFGIDSNYRPVECAGDPSGNLTWHEF